MKETWKDDSSGFLLCHLSFLFSASWLQSMSLLRSEYRRKKWNGTSSRVLTVTIIFPSDRWNDMNNMQLTDRNRFVYRRSTYPRFSKPSATYQPCIVAFQELGILPAPTLRFWPWQACSGKWGFIKLWGTDRSGWLDTFRLINHKLFRTGLSGHYNNTFKMAFPSCN